MLGRDVRQTEPRPHGPPRTPGSTAPTPLHGFTGTASRCKFVSTCPAISPPAPSGIHFSAWEKKRIIHPSLRGFIFAPFTRRAVDQSDSFTFCEQNLFFVIFWDAPLIEFHTP
jgi:hypothetical protein